MSNRLFTTVPIPKFPSSTFSLSRPVLFTPRMHKEYPTEILEVIPGDGFKIWTEAYAKSQPMVAPVFAKMDTAQESFFVPAWQLSERFDDFITGGERGMNTDKMPYVSIGAVYSLIYSAIVYFLNQIDGEQEGAFEMYNEGLTKVQDILESMDIMRSVPFVVPEFVLMPETWDASILTANLTAFTDANSHLGSSELRINLLPFAAVLKIYTEFYRDENLCEDLYEICWLGKDGGFLSRDFSKQIGSQDSYFLGLIGSADWPEIVDYLHGLFGLKSRAWKKDYYTSALPFVQKGPDVMLPLEGTGIVQPYSTGTGGTRKSVVMTGSGSAEDTKVTLQQASTFEDIDFRLAGGAIGSSIQNLRTAFKLEEMYEADGRFGNRYPENTLGQFGVHTPDSRLPRCQFLGSNTQPIQIQQVIQTSATEKAAGNAQTPQGNLAGLSSSYGSNRLAKTYQSQHGFIVCLSCIRVHSLYEQGIHPMFSRFDRTEYAWPRFAHLGEQPIYLKQLFVNDDVAEDEVFGYTPRYADYKSDTGSIHGLLKGSLNYWTMARRFANKPQLNEDFIYSRPRQDAFVVANHLQPCFIMEIDYHVRANRKLPFYGNPHM